jgi:hypothetical protein
MNSKEAHQWLFDASLARIRAQGAPSMKDGSVGTCLYRGPGDRRCGAGDFILRYNTQMECNSWTNLCGDPRWQDDLDPLAVREQSFVGELQTAHDNAATESLRESRPFMPNYEAKMAALAINHGLKYVPAEVQS